MGDASVKPVLVETLNVDGRVFCYIYDKFKEAEVQYSLLKASKSCACVILYKREGGIRYMHTRETK